MLISVLIPYLLVRYEKVFAINKDYRDFLSQADVYTLEWLSVTNYNIRIIDEFLEVLAKPDGVYAKDFQFYDFPPIGFFRTYNSQLLNEFYFQVRGIKDLEHHLKMVSSEYLAYKRMRSNRDAILPTNGNHFFILTITNVKERLPEIIEEIKNLRIRVSLLLSEVNRTDSLSMKKFFSFGQKNRLWYKKDLQFTLEEIKTEEKKLEDRDSEAMVKKSF
ncbi:MAG: hypothetical protein WCG55_04095 [bacterium]